MYRIEQIPLPEGVTVTALVREEQVGDRLIRMSYDADLLALKPSSAWGATLDAEWAFRVGGAQ